MALRAPVDSNEMEVNGVDDEDSPMDESDDEDDILNSAAPVLFDSFCGADSQQNDGHSHGQGQGGRTQMNRSGPGNRQQPTLKGRDAKRRRTGTGAQGAQPQFAAAAAAPETSSAAGIVPKDVASGSAALAAPSSPPSPRANKSGAPKAKKAKAITSGGLHGCSVNL